MWFKGRAAVALDAWYEGDVEANLHRAREWLSDHELSFADMAGRLNLVFAGKDICLADADDDHPEYAFDYPIPDGALQGDAFENVMRSGYLEAIGLALGHSPPVPIRTYWMTGVGNKRFEMHISDSAQHVAVTLFVPKVEGGSRHTHSPEGWKVVADRHGVATAVQTSGPPTDVQPSMRGASGC
jgi:hypothetical protein